METLPFTKPEEKPAAEDVIPAAQKPLSLAVGLPALGPTGRWNFAAVKSFPEGRKRQCHRGGLFTIERAVSSAYKLDLRQVMKRPPDVGVSIHLLQSVRRTWRAKL